MKTRPQLDIATSSFIIDSPKVLPENEVHIWRADLDALQPEETRWREILSSDEIQRADRFHFPADRKRFTSARAWLRLILAAYLNTAPKDLRFIYSRKEKPSLDPTFIAADLLFNVSHSAGIALYAFARSIDVGVDVESVHRDGDHEAIAKRFFSPIEQEQLAAFSTEEKTEAFFRCWTRKEAYIKATGDGLSLPLSQFDVSLEALSRDALVATRPNPDEAKLWTLREVPAGEGFVGALCARGRNLSFKLWSD